MDDLPDIIRELTEVAARWKDIGILLGIPANQLETLQLQVGRPQDYLREMLTIWLRKNYNLTKFGEPTWSKLVDAIRDSAGGGNSDLAMKIAKRHEGKMYRTVTDISYNMELMPA